jgi:hypothetical protein
VIGATVTPGRAIIDESWAWIGAILVLGTLAVLGALLIRRDLSHAAVLALLLAAGLLVTLEALRLHSNESMQKHDDFGAWFTCIAAGYVLSGLAGRDPHGQVLGRACLAIRPHCMYLEGVAGYRAAIHAHWFTLITMIGNHELAQDAAIERAVEDTPGYVLLTRVGGQPTWIYAPAYRAGAK